MPATVKVTWSSVVADCPEGLAIFDGCVSAGNGKFFRLLQVCFLLFDEIWVDVGGFALLAVEVPIVVVNVAVDLIVLNQLIQRVKVLLDKPVEVSNLRFCMGETIKDLIGV